jgi:uncharacterized membrane protein
MKIVKIIAAIALLLFTVLMTQLTLPYLSLATDVDFLLTKQGVLHNKIWYYSFYTHITTSLIVLLLGIFQFSNTMIKKYTKIHRLFGQIYVGLILFCSATSGFVMALYANGGFWAKVSFVMTSILWWLFTALAYWHIRQHNVQAHQAYMYRSYALTLSAITLRIYVLSFPFLLGLRGKELYVIVAWLSWLPNLLICEIYLYFKQLAYKNTLQ